MKLTRIVGIAGGSCAGKGKICSYVKEKLSPRLCDIISMDSYYRSLSGIPMQFREQTNFDSPDALDIKLLLAHIRIIAAGGSVEIPIYDFTTHTRSPGSKRLCASGKIILLEGLFALYWEEIRKHLWRKVFIEVGCKASLERRIRRDLRKRGRSRESVEKQFYKTVLPMYNNYVLPTRSYADVILSGDRPIDRLVDKVLCSISTT